MRIRFFTLALFCLPLVLSQHSIAQSDNAKAGVETSDKSPEDNSSDGADPGKYVQFRLTTDIPLSQNEIQVIALLIQAADEMDKCFWKEAFGDKSELFKLELSDAQRRFADINYGPWDRLDGNKPFIAAFGEKPKGACFYPQDMTKVEFEDANLEHKEDLYTIIERGNDGALKTVPYRDKFKKEHKKAASLLNRAAELTEDPQLKNYLQLRANALLTDEYRESDMAWLDMKSNKIDVVIGPIETYEDQLYGYKAAHEAYVLVKDMEWSERLARFAQYLPELQEGLPVEEQYKSESPGTDTELNAYDVVYYAGDCNAGSKTIAINLPNDEQVQLEKGTRRLQLKNAMRAKFDKILVPISDQLIDESQRSHITFDAFFSNTMFHEVAHGLGIKNTINGNGTVRKALKEHSSAIEEGKADVLGLYMIQQMHKRGELTSDLMDHYVTFMASIFRSVRFGASSAHGKANMIRFNYFKQEGAFQRDAATGHYKVNKEKFEMATEKLSRLIIELQGNGDYEGAATLVSEKGTIGETLQVDLDKLAANNIPVDIIFEQGIDLLTQQN